jgi:tRNA pseudouridine55 synthase
MDKTYEATIRFGFTSATFDAEGLDPEATAASVPPLSSADIDALLLEFVGGIRQQVPLYSAVQVNGERLHRIARRGGEAERPVREVTIHEIERLEWKSPDLQIRIHCSSGTYIRTLADDLGRKAGCGAYLAGLKRTRVGHLDLSAAMTLEQVQEAAETGTLTERLLHPDDVLRLGAIRVADAFCERVIQGLVPTEADIAGFEGRFRPGDHVLLKDSRGAVLAIGTAGVGSDSTQVADSDIFTYVRVLN